MILNCSVCERETRGYFVPAHNHVDRTKQHGWYCSECGSGPVHTDEEQIQALRNVELLDKTLKHVQTEMISKLRVKL